MSTTNIMAKIPVCNNVTLHQKQLDLYYDKDTILQYNHSKFHVSLQ